MIAEARYIYERRVKGDKYRDPGRILNKIFGVTTELKRKFLQKEFKKRVKKYGLKYRAINKSKAQSISKFVIVKLAKKQ